MAFYNTNTAGGAGGAGDDENLCDNILRHIWVSNSSVFVNDPDGQNSMSFVVPIVPGRDYIVKALKAGNRERMVFSEQNPLDITDNDYTYYGTRYVYNGDRPTVGLEKPFTAASNENYLIIYCTNTAQEDVEYDVRKVPVENSRELCNSYAGIVKRIAAEPALPTGITSIRRYCFYDYDELVKVTIPDSVTSIGYQAFYGCTKLEQVVLPDGIKNISSSTFCECKALTSIKLPSELTYIDNYAFASCTSISTLEIPSKVTTIEYDAFRSCSSLKEVTFKGTPTLVASNAFYNCENITTINVPWAEGAVSGAPWGATNATINYNYTA